MPPSARRGGRLQELTTCWAACGVRAAPLAVRLRGWASPPLDVLGAENGAPPPCPQQTRSRSAASLQPHPAQRAGLSELPQLRDSALCPFLARCHPW